MTDDDLIARLRSAGKHPMMDNNCKVDVFDVHSAADRIEALVKERAKAALWATEQHACADNYALRLGQEKARAERLEAALRAIQTYLQEPAPENKLNDLRNDLRWIGNRARAALKGDDHD